MTQLFAVNKKAAEMGLHLYTEMKCSQIRIQTKKQPPVRVAVLFEALLPDQNAGTTAPLYFSVMKSLIS